MRSILFPLAALVVLSSGACSPAPAPLAPDPPPPTALVAAAAPVASSAPLPEPAPPAACFPKALASSELFDARLDTGGLVVCLMAADGAQDNPCLRVDLTTRAVAIAPQLREKPAAPEPVPPRFTLKTTPTEATVCPAAGPAKECRTVRAPGKAVTKVGHGDASREDLIGTVSDDGQRLALLVAQRDPKVAVDTIGAFRVTVEVHDLAKKKRLSRTSIPAGTDKAPGFFADQSDNWSVRFLGDRLLLSDYVCCGPAGQQEVLDPARGSFLHLGDPAVFLPAGGEVWLVANEERGEPPAVTASFVHLDTGKRTRVQLPSLPRDEPETHALEALKLDGSRWLVVHANPPGLVWLDGEKETIADQMKLPLCP
jgi:hypothetical protein